MFNKLNMYTEKPEVKLPYVVPEEIDPENPQVWMTIRIGENGQEQKIIFELFKKIVPKTVENFLQLCIGS